MTHRKTARDTQRRSDLNTLLMAYEMYYEKNGTYQVNAGYGCGSFLEGSGYVNNDYGCEAINTVLIRSGYLSTTVRDPGTSEGNQDYYVHFPTDAADGYAGWTTGICIYAKLESRTEDDINQWDNLTTLTPGSNRCWPDTAGVGYNYVVGNFK